MNLFSKKYTCPRCEQNIEPNDFSQKRTSMEDESVEICNLCGEKEVLIKAKLATDYEELVQQNFKRRLKN